MSGLSAPKYAKWRLHTASVTHSHALISDTTCKQLSDLIAALVSSFKTPLLCFVEAQVQPVQELYINAGMDSCQYSSSARTVQSEEV